MPERYSWSDVLGEVVGRELAAEHRAGPGEISGFSRTTFSGDVQPLWRPPSATEDIPMVRGVRVLFPGVYWDLHDGVTGLLVCCDYDFSRWWNTGRSGEPTHLRRSTWSQSIFIPGLFQKSDVGALALSAGAMVLPGSDVRLADPAATEAAVLGNSQMTAITTWAAAVSAAITGLGGDISGATTTLGTDLAAALSSSVKVGS